MKPSKDWLTQEKAEKAFETLITDRGWVVGEFTGYAAAKALGVHPNREFYLKFDPWLKTKLRELEGQPLKDTSEFPQPLRAKIEGVLAEIETAWVDRVESTVAMAARSAEQRVAHAQRIAEASREELEHVTAQWGEAEQERDEACKRIAKLEQQLADAHKRLAEHEATLAERERQLERLIASVQASRSEVVAGHTDKGAIASDENAASATVGLPEEGLAEAASGPPASGPDEDIDQDSPFDDRPSASEPGRPAGGQSELPLASDDSNPEGEDR
jgi:hypothetical protein